MSMECRYCGQPLAEDMKFCVRCGRPTSLGEEEVAFVESPEITGPLPRLDEQGDVAEAARVDAEGEEAAEEATGGDDEGADAGVEDSATQVVAEEDAARESAVQEDAGQEAAADRAAAPSQDESEAPDEAPDQTGEGEGADAAGTSSVAGASAGPAVVAVHKSRVPTVILSVVIALVVGCACFVGGLYVAKTGLLEEWGLVPAAPAETQPAEPAAEAAAPEDTPATGEAASGVDDGRDARGAETSDEVAVAVQEGWEALIAADFSEEVYREWTETVLSLQPEGVLEAYAALVGVEGDSLLPLYLFDAMPTSNEEAIKEFLGNDAAAVSVDRVPADEKALASLTVYFGDLGQSVAGQVESLTLPLETADAFNLELTVMPMADDGRESDGLSVQEGSMGYMAYEYEGRWYLLAPELTRMDA